MIRENLVDEFIRTRLNEGGHRVRINPEIKEAFINAICLIKDPVKRQEEMKNIFDEIRERNLKEFERNSRRESIEGRE